MRQTFCAYLLIRQVLLETLREICIGYLELRPKTCENVKSAIVWNVSFGRSFKNTCLNNSTIFNFALVELSIIAVKVCARPMPQPLDFSTHANRGGEASSFGISLQWSRILKPHPVPRQLFPKLKITIPTENLVSSNVRLSNNLAFYYV